MKNVHFTLKDGRYTGAVDDGPSFFIGSRVTFQGRKGLMNVVGKPGQRYDRAEYRPEFGFWADFITPTANAEGALFHTLNTYDRARFTFSFLQYAAHVPDGDFVRYLHELLKLPLAAEYFPDLVLVNGRVHRDKNGVKTRLEDSSSTEGLMNYLNPGSSAVEDTEVVSSAKFIHWVQNDSDHRHLQVRLGVEHFREKMKAYSRRYKLDGKSEVICLLVADIRHQGRGDSAISTALSSANPEANLLKIGAGEYPARIASLKTSIANLRKDNSFGKFIYNQSLGDFDKV
ncbi:MAG: hypothetical protein KIS61_21255 [Candidatus Eremiobacteraeota bacterium]|nr:hypothetical protein [Candidatus Eremiobacteraeota bacterium]